MSDLERELRAMLDDRAGRVESDLTGPELRGIAAARAVAGRGRVRRTAPVLASAAAVAALGIGAALLAAPSDDPRPVQPGGPRPVTSATATPSPPATPALSARPVPSRPSTSLRRITLPSETAVPTRSGDLPLQSLLIDPPRSSATTAPSSRPSAPSRPVQPTQPSQPGS